MMYKLEYTFSNRPYVKMKCGFTRRSVMLMFKALLIVYALENDLRLDMTDNDEKRWVY